MRVGAETFETTLGAYGGRTFLGLRKALLTSLGVAAGDVVHVELEPGTPPEEPTPEPVPTTSPELETALATDETLARAWAALPESHRVEYGRWISGPPDAETRGTRLARLHHRLTR